MILSLLVVAQLTTAQPKGIELDNSVAKITEPADIQPAIGYNAIQGDYKVVLVQKPVKSTVCGLDPCLDYLFSPLFTSGALR